MGAVIYGGSSPGDFSLMVAEKTFRSDRYYRRNVFPASLPPLGERPDDIPHWCIKMRRLGITISRQAL